MTKDADKTVSANKPAPTAQPAVNPGRPAPADEFIRAANEDDDGRDPYSDRRPASEPMFEHDP